MRDPYPLQWPADLARTPHDARKKAPFRSASAYQAAIDVTAELRRFGAGRVVITSDLPRRADGLPYASGQIDDPGIAVYAELRGSERVFACDCWWIAAHNLRAIAKSIEAMRGIDRWGMADMTGRMLCGFKALPAALDWRAILGLVVHMPVELDDRPLHELVEGIHAAYRLRMRDVHPDTGGTHEAAAQLNAAREAALEEISAAHYRIHGFAPPSR